MMEVTFFRDRKNAVGLRRMWHRWELGLAPPLPAMQ